jgi:hypothetical protein
LAVSLFPAFQIVKRAHKGGKIAFMALSTAFVTFNLAADADVAQAAPRIPAKVFEETLEKAGQFLARQSAEEEKLLTKAVSIWLKTGKMSPALRMEVARVMKNVLEREATVIVENTPKALAIMWKKIVKKHPVLEILPTASVQRAIYKFAPDHIKGQILEEFGMQFIKVILKSRRQSWLLLIRHYLAEGYVLQFIPGHRIVDAMSKQFSDGMLVLRYVGKKDAQKLSKLSASEIEELAWKAIQTSKEKPTLVIVVIEVKAGKSASREILVGDAKKFSDLTVELKNFVTVEAQRLKAAREVQFARKGEEYL